LAPAFSNRRSRDPDLLERLVQTVRRIADLRDSLTRWRGAGERIGLVPTMGALHRGHMALVAAARQGCDRVAATIFVNPKQFAPSEDLAAYPRRESADLAMLSETGVDLAYLPTLGEMYPPDFSTVVRVAELSEGLCGDHRVGHFDGVATVVAKLLIQSLPHAAYFGEKDYQQLLVVRRLARDLDLPIDIIGVPTVREPDGLALSSRNTYLSPSERRSAPLLARLLRGTVGALGRDPAAVAGECTRARAELARAGFEVDYFEVRDAATLAPVIDAVIAPARVFAAVYLGRTRLIDNMPIER
jgi:pantoate--beta-alanine ligase